MPEAAEQKHTRYIVSAEDYNSYGCPHCGGIYGYTPMQVGGEITRNCSDCNTIFSVIDPEFCSESQIDKLQEHPRKDKSIDRDQLVAEHEANIRSTAFSGLHKWLRLGYGHKVRVSTVGEHVSKSQKLPILAADSPSGTNVVWYADNYHSHFLGLQLSKPLSAALLYPIVYICVRGRARLYDDGVLLCQGAGSADPGTPFI